MKRLIYLLLILGILDPLFTVAQDENLQTGFYELPENQEDVLQLINTAKDLLSSKNYVEASRYLFMAETNGKFLSDQQTIGDLYFNLATLFLNTGLSEDALNFCRPAYSSYKNIGNVESELQVILLTAFAYSSLNKYDSSNAQLKLGLKIAQENAKSEIVATIFTKLGFNHTQVKDYENAVMYYQSAELIFQSGKQIKDLAYNNLAIGKILLQQIDNSLTKSSFDKALEYSLKIKLNTVIAESSNFLGKIAMQENKPSEALKYFQTVIDLPDADDINLLKSESYENSAKISESSGNFKSALQHSKQAKQYLFLANKYIDAENLNSILIKDKVKENKNIFVNERIQKELFHRKAELSFYLTLSIIITSILIIIILILFFRNRIKIKIINSDFEQKQKDLKFLKNALKEFDQKLETEVKIRTKDIQEELNKRLEIDLDLKKALKNAEDANYLKNAFLSNMSHEIRTPLNGIIGFSNLLVTELSIMENQELYEFASGIQESGDRLLHLLNNIIDISRIEANDMEMKLTPCNSNEIIESVTNLYKFKANEKKLKFNTKYNEIPDVLADEHNITKIISDIIDNAVKYTEKGFINVVTNYDAEKKVVIISIKDTGIGIDESYIDHVFEAFRQESLGYSRNYQGAGLGLPLAKRLINLMKGDIIVESKKGVGTTVKILLTASDTPVESHEASIIAEEKAEIQEQPKDEKINIFIVEDDRMNRLVLSKMLDKVGNNSLAVDGEETISVIERAYQNGLIFDIMLFDINLPAPWDGIKLMNEIKNRWKEYKFVPFIAQTAYAMAGDKERLLDSGFDNYIAKPVNKNELINIIFKHIGIREKK